MEHDITDNEKIEYFKEKIILAKIKNIKLHLNLRSNNAFRNGYVTEIMPDFFIFNDHFSGEEPIFFIDLKKVKPYLEKED